MRVPPLMLADVFDDEMTRELPSALKTFTDLDPFLGAEPVAYLEPPASGSSTRAPASIDTGARAVLPELTVVVGAIVLVWSCAVAGIAGAVAGHTSSDHALLRVPRVAVVMAAHEAITEPPPMAPEKDADATEPTPIPTPLARVASAPPRATTAAAPAPAAPEPHRPGFQRPKSLRRR